MRTLIFDIETVGEEWQLLDETTKDVLTRWVDRTGRSEAERAVQLKDIEDGLGFSALTGKIVAIGMYDYELQKGAVYFENGASQESVFQDGSYQLKSRTEAEMLEDFWVGASEYDTFVSFNGRGFDVPFINLRSVVYGIRPSQDLLEGRYLYQQKSVRHIDLLDQLTFYGATQRRPSLHLFCRAFGIKSPKVDGVSGDDVATLYKTKKFETIARYNARDVTATAALYSKWLKYLAPQKFITLLNR